MFQTSFIHGPKIPDTETHSHQRSTRDRLWAHCSIQWRSKCEVSWDYAKGKQASLRITDNWKVKEKWEKLPRLERLPREGKVLGNLCLWHKLNKCCGNLYWDRFLLSWAKSVGDPHPPCMSIYPNQKMIMICCCTPFVHLWCVLH